MRYITVPVTPFQQNATVLWCEETMRGAVVDPGGDIDRLLKVADSSGIALEKVLLTHGHLDHAGGANQLARERQIRIWGPHRSDAFWLDGMEQQCRVFGLPVTMSAVTPDHWLDAGEKVSVGATITFDVLHCPGHTPGHVIFFEPKARLALVGDVLFAGSVGRTDFPGGDHDTLIRSIREQLFPLGDDVTFIPGHGPQSTFGEERRSNPFVADRSAGWRSRL